MNMPRISAFYLSAWQILNPVKHGYVEKWADWPFSSAADFLQREGRARVKELWRKYPIKKMGEGWDD